MNFAALFGEDQHVATEDAYVRIMKCRKWVVLAAMGYYLTHATLIGPQPFNILVAKVIVPLDILGNTTLAGLVYILLQYLLLAVQYLDQYPVLAEERYGRREAERIRALERERQILIDQPIRTEGDMMSRERANDQRREKIKQIEAAIRNYDPKARPSFAYRLADVLMDATRLAAPLIAVLIVVVLAAQA